MKIIKLLDLIYPPVCGICSKGKNVYLCKKCEKILQIKAVFGSEKYEDKYFSNHMYIFKYDGIIRELILKYKFNEKPYLYKIFTNFLEKFKKNNLNLEKYDIIIDNTIFENDVKIYFSVNKNEAEKLISAIFAATNAKRNAEIIGERLDIPKKQA